MGYEDRFFPRDDERGDEPHRNEEAYNEYQEIRRYHDETGELKPEHKAKMTHEFLGAAAAFAAAKGYESYREKNGHPENHAFAKEALAGLAGGWLTKEFETKGEDFIDEEKAKHAQRHAERDFDEAVDRHGY